MPEVLATFPRPVLGSDGVSYAAQACGAAAADGFWEGWLEFAPVDGGQPVRSPRETTQPNRKDAIYWAGGLTLTYLEGALERALRPLSVQRNAASQPLFDGPAPAFSVTRPAARQSSVLDPFSVYAKGEPLLRQELGALSEWHLVNIVLAYDLSPEPEPELQRLPKADLVDTIVTAVRQYSVR